MAAGLASAAGGRARAEGTDFGYSYGAAIAGTGETELALWATDRGGKGDGHYDARDYRLEVERGITDRLQMSVYANLASHHIRGLEPKFEHIDRDLGFQGLSAEFIYALRKPVNGRLGVAIYAEPGWSRIDRVSGEHSTEYELELKAILQKNFAHDRLVWVGNVTLEPEWEQERAEDPAGGDEAEWKKELKFGVTSGLAWRVAPRWSAGVEGRYASVYPDWTHGLHRAAYAVSAGPAVHYSVGEFGITATWLPQLFGGPNATGAGLNLDEYERQEFRLKLGYEF